MNIFFAFGSVTEGIRRDSVPVGAVLPPADVMHSIAGRQTNEGWWAIPDSRASTVWL